MPPENQIPKGHLPKGQPSWQNQQIYSPENLSSPQPDNKNSKKKIILVICLILLIGAGLYAFYENYIKAEPIKPVASTQTTQANPNSAQFETKTLTNGGYTYSFEFYKQSNLIQVSATSNAYKYLNDVIAGVQPSKSPIPSDCTQIGSQWHEVFPIEVNGNEHKVCSPFSKLFSMYFSALNQNHLFTITFNQSQSSSIYPTLKEIFSSVQVSK